MHQKVNVLIFIRNLCLEQVVLEEKYSSLAILLSLSSLPPKEISLNIYYNDISLPLAPPFSNKAPLSHLPPQNPLDHVDG